MKREKVSKAVERKLGFKPGPMSVLVKVDPAFEEFYKFCDSLILRDGALPAKYKMLLVMCIGAARMCDNCVTQAMKAALNLGASREEVLEALKVTFAASGSQSVQTARKALEELFKA